MRISEWRDRAACRGMDPNLFFPERGERVDRLRAICAACDVRAECLTFALEQRVTFGFWGAKTEHQRRRLRNVPRTDCACCGRPMLPTRANQRYCSTACRYEQKKVRERAKRAA